MIRNISMMLILLVVFPCLFAQAGQVSILQPGSVLSESRHDTLSWRSLSEPTVNFWFHPGGVGDSIAVWFQPEGPCSLIAIRLYSLDCEGTCLADVWDGSRYDGHITTTDSTDTNGWIGKDLDGEWFPGHVLGHSPIGGETHGTGHIWGPFPFVITEYHLGKWFEIPTKAGLQKEVDLGNRPFFISVVLYQTAGHGWAAEDEGTVPFHSFYYYAEYDQGRPGPDGHFGWFIHNASLWFEAVVSYYDITSAEEDNEPEIPCPFYLYQNYPNPFNPTTDIEYILTEASAVTFEVYNTLGQVVDILVNSEQEAGHHHVSWNGENMASGVYFYRLQAGDFISTKRMILLR